MDDRKLKGESIRIRKRPGLRSLMLLLGMIILVMPISGLYLFRIYENEVIRQTEAELISQAALLASAFKKEILELTGPHYGQRIAAFTETKLFIEPSLDLSTDEIMPRGLSFRPSPYEPEAAALKAAARLEQTIEEAGRITLASAMFLDYHGLMVSERSGQGLSFADNYEVAEALSGRPQSVLRVRPVAKSFPLSSRSRGTGYRVFLAMPVMNDDRLLGVVYLSRTPREILKALHSERRNVALAAALSLGLAMAVSLIVAILIIRPIRRLANDSKAVSDGDSPGFSPASHPIVPRELAELRSRVAEMAERLNRRSDYLKAFASGVSHEFKTPLTSIKGAMELMGDHGADMPPATRERFENNIKADLERLERLVGRLLALARAEARAETHVAEAETTDASALVERLAEHYKAEGFAVYVNPAPLPLKLAVAADALETVIRNLFDNSRDAGAQMVAVDLGFNEAQGLGLIVITDNGPGIKPEMAESIFQPFFTTRKNRGGTGLGLSLTRTLLAPYRGDVFWDGNDPGAVFVITLPLI